MADLRKNVEVKKQTGISTSSGRRMNHKFRPKDLPPFWHASGPVHTDAIPMFASNTQAHVKLSSVFCESPVPIIRIGRPCPCPKHPSDSR